LAISVIRSGIGGQGKNADKHFAAVNPESQARAYRNRLAHHVRPSVDYSMFFAALESRVGEEIKDAQGNVIGRRFPLLSRPPAEYQFKDLDEAFSEYLDAVVAMLEKLSALAILRR